MCARQELVVAAVVEQRRGATSKKLRETVLVEVVGKDRFDALTSQQLEVAPQLASVGKRCSCSDTPHKVSQWRLSPPPITQSSNVTFLKNLAWFPKSIYHLHNVELRCGFEQ